MSVAHAARPRSFALAATSLILLALFPAAPVTAKDHGPGGGVIVSSAVAGDVSAKPLSSMAPAPRLDPKDKKEKKKFELPDAWATDASDPVVQSQAGTGAASATGTGFDGIGVGLGSYSPVWAPADTNGAVGPNHYVEIVNADLAVFSKDGTPVKGPVPTNTLWSDFPSAAAPGNCATRDDGDGVVEYDRAANRWIVTQFTNDGTNTECVAVSTGPDPTGTYARYAFTYPAFPDYPKLSVWPDAYYITFNLFGQFGFSGAMACAWDRTKMLAGRPANEVTQQCFNLSTAYGGLLPSDVDGGMTPPAGSPNYLLNFGSNRLNLWKFHVDWTNPALTTFTGPTAISVAPFTAACNGGSCVPQPGTNQKLGSLADRLMTRLAYRNFGDHESLVVNHSVATGTLNQGPSGVRWYELRVQSGSLGVYQQGTYAPDSVHRWMGSAAMDHSGDIAVGYSASSTSVSPSIRYAARLAGDPLGSLTQAEVVLQGGSGSQLPNLDRWGDYSSMTVDPTDDCTFWYATEYLKSNGTWNWSTRVSSFSLPGCNAPVTTGVLEGVVRNSASPGAPLSGATVSIQGGPSATTDSSGTYRFSSLTAGSYNVTASMTGYTSSTANNVAVTAGNTTTQDFALVQPASVPSAPRNLTATRSTTKGVRLSWTVPSSLGGAPSVTYNVYRGTTSSAITTSIATGRTATTYDDTATTAGRRYWYRVTAVNGTGESAPSNTANAKAR
ncbi:MAG: carboxypeptidase regulatory-like domain-containing protein [Chloroflexota bacterium]